MGRTVHYRTLDTITQKQFEHLLQIVDRYNSKNEWKLERLKLWHERDSVKTGKAWGFTKIRESEEAEQVLEAVKEMSFKTPRTIWTFYDEGGREASELLLKEGKILER